MTITKELLEHILKTTQEPEKIAGAIKHYQRIYSLVNVNRAKEMDALAKYQQEKQALKEERKELRRSCDHPIFSFNSDPAGGSDSFNECGICGYSW